MVNRESNRQASFVFSDLPFTIDHLPALK